MKKVLLFLSIGIGLIGSVLAQTSCFVAKENGCVLKKEGACESRYAPCSTFKIAISLMGYDAGILLDEETPELPFEEGFVDYIPAWTQPHNPTRWMKNSCLWYSQFVTQKLGREKFDSYVKKFNYGNLDTSGDKGQENGLTRSWLSSSLQISPEEQVEFLQKLIGGQLPVSLQAHDMTKKLLFLEMLDNGWKLCGKTGCGRLRHQGETCNQDSQIGWFVGWIEKGPRTIIFAQVIEDKDKKNLYASFLAKETAKKTLKALPQETQAS